MDFPQPIAVQEIAEEFGLKLIGETDLKAIGINEIHKVRAGDITFVDYEKYYSKSLKSAATIIIIDQEIEAPQGKCLLIADEPFEVYDTLVKRYSSNEIINQRIHPTAEIHPSVILESNVVIGANVKINEGSYIRANTVILDKTEIGENVVIESNCSIGSDAFYFKKYKSEYTRWTTGGRVIIADDVFIGAGTTIARGVSGDTIIGRGSKLDANIQIAHGVVIGENCLIASQVGIAGKTIVGDRVIMYGQVGVAQNLNIGDDCIILAQSGIGNDLETGKVYFGSPAIEARAKMKEIAHIRQMVKNQS